MAPLSPKENLPIRLPATSWMDMGLLAFTKTHTWVMLALVLIAGFHFNKLPVTQVTDGQFSLLLSHAIINDSSTRLDPYLDRAQYLPQKNFFYWYWQLSPKREGKVVTDHGGGWNGTDALYYRYPTLPSILSIPGVWLAGVFGLSVLDERQMYYHKNEQQIHRYIAAVVAAITVGLVFRMALLLLPWMWALAIAVVSGWGTQIVSTLSRGVWSDTWALPISLLAVHHLLAVSLGKASLRPIYLAIISALAFFCKPNYAVVGMMAFAFTLTLASRKQLITLMITGGVFVLGFMVFSLLQFGTIIPDYYQPALQWKYLPNALTGHLFSPSRGLFIYCPYLLVVIYTLIYYRKSLCVAKLALLTWIPIVVLMLVSSAWNTWWGGHSYGPRLIIPLLPWTILLSIIALEAYGRHAGVGKKTVRFTAKVNSQTNANPQAFSFTAIRKAPLFLALWIVTITISIAINVHGASEPKTWLDWFYKPYPVFNDPEKRVWDWSDPQWLAGIKTRPHEQ